MSDIRFNQWLHQSGTGGVSQSDGGHVGIGTTNPLLPVGAGNTHILHVGVVTSNSISAGSSITATTFYGSGANLTSLPSQLSTSNMSDNRVVTSSGGVVFNGEANLTFDGSTLGLTGVFNSGGNVNCTSGRFQRGSATVQDGDAIAGGININGLDMDASVIMSIFGNDGDFTRISGSKSRNASVGSHTIVQDNDVLLSLKGFGSDGTNFEEAAQIEMQVDGTPNNNVMPGRIVFKTTTTDGVAERLRIDSNGKFCLGTYNSNFASNDGIVSIVNAASGGTENPLITLWNPTTAADARASIDFLTNAHSGTGRDGAFIRASNDGSTAKAHLIFGTILNETYTKTVKFDTDGDVELVDGDLVIQTSGHGIDFSARSGSNAGASSSILDDYEEGVYQPTMTGSGGGSHTFVSYTHIAYTKIGRLVHIQGYINVNGGSLTGNLKLSLPFTVSNDASGHSRYPAIGLSWRGHGWSGNTGEITFAPQPNTTHGEFVSVAPSGSHTWVNNTHVSNSYNIRIGGCYITNT